MLPFYASFTAISPPSAQYLLIYTHITPLCFILNDHGLVVQMASTSSVYEGAVDASGFSASGRGRCPLPFIASLRCLEDLCSIHSEATEILFSVEIFRLIVVPKTDFIPFNFFWHVTPS
jgi:hypothetical protein